MKRLGMSIVAAVAAFAVAPAANATQLISFGQASGSGSPVTATANGAQTATTIAASNLAIQITDLLGTSGVVNAVLNLTANSTSIATQSGPFVQQNYDGVFSIISGGTNYLSGSFTGFTFGFGSSATLAGSEPNSIVTFTSNYFAANQLGSPRALSFSFSNVSPQSAVCGQTLCSFTAAVSGTLSAAAVPEPATWGMMLLGFGVVGGAMRRRQRVAVRYA